MFYKRLYVEAAVLAIDYGQEWIKAALVKHGIPIEIVLTKESKRKDRSVIAFNGEERLYGIRAAEYASRNPSSSFPSLKSLIGKSYTSEDVKKYLALHQNIDLIQSANGMGIAFLQNNKTFTVEELTAMIFENYKNLAEEIAGEKIKDVVITIPSYFTEIERHAILDVAEIAGLNVLSLISDGLAIAINYATTRLFDEKPQYHIFYDMGAGSTTATFVSFRTKVSSKNKTITAVEVMGVGYNRHLGGDTITWKLVDYVLDQLEKSKGSEIKAHIKSHSKAIAKLFYESSRIKQILSVNSEARIMIENLYEDIDCDVKVTRDNFEKLMEEFSEEITKPIIAAVSMTPIAIRFVSSIVLAGGGSRVPFVQKQIENFSGLEKVSKSVNADEAAVMGAVFRGAGLSGQFRVKNIKSSDIILNSVYISYPKDSLAVAPRISHSLFIKGTKLGAKKTLVFYLSDNFDIDFSHVINYPVFYGKFATLKLTGFNESLNVLKREYGCNEFAASVTFSLDISGLITVSNALLKCRNEKEERRDFFKFMHRGYNRRLERENFINEDESSNFQDINENSRNKENKSRSLNFEILYNDVNPQNKVFKLASKNMLRDLNEIDKKRIVRDEARNILETYIYNVQESLETEDFIAVSTQEQREELSNVVQNVKQWLGKNGDVSSLNELLERKKIIAVLEEPISERKNDARERSIKISELKRRIDGFKHYLGNLPIEKIDELSHQSDENHLNLAAENILKETDFNHESGLQHKVLEPGFKPETVEAYRTNVMEVEKWLDESVIAQEALKPWEPSKLRVKDIVSKIWELEKLKENIRIMEHVFLKSRNIKRQETKKTGSSTI
ncbi:hypothetical protein PCANB_002120 [Pneumocystis canis]|nr:hypothetical protein PCANB_002120 [Pneumocystis canis]